MGLPTVLFVGPALVCILAWLGVGAALPARFLPGDALASVLTRVAFGSLAFTLLVFVLGRLHVLVPAVLFALTVVAAVVGAVWARQQRFRLPRGLGRIGWTLLTLAVVALALDVIASTAPPTSADALVYHVEFPRRWLELHRIDDPFWNYAAFYPLGIETLFAQAMAVVGGGGAGSAMAAGSAASALHGLFAVLAAVAVFGLGRELGGGRDAAGVLGAALFVLQGLVTWDATSTFIDMGLVFYGALAAWHVVRFARRPEIASAVWAGVACGGALGAKYIGPLVAAFVLLGLALASLRRRPAALAWAIVSALVVGGAWYVKNAVVTGNPIYPLLFGGKLWNAPAQNFLDRSATLTYPGTHTFPLRIFALPVDLLLHGSRFDRGEYVSTATLLLAPAAVLATRSRELLRVFLVVAAFVLVWWYWAPQARYLLPALAVLAAVAGAGLAPILSRSGLGRVVLLAVLGASAVVWLASSAALTRRLLPVAVGAESRAQNVQRLLGTYDAMQAIRRRIGDAPIGFAQSYQMIYWYPGRAILLGLPEFETQSPRPLFLDRLRRVGVRDVAFWGDLSQYPQLRGCARHVGGFHARYVTSRSKGTSVPMRLDVYSVAACVRK